MSIVVNVTIWNVHVFWNVGAVWFDYIWDCGWSFSYITDFPDAVSSSSWCVVCTLDSSCWFSSYCDFDIFTVLTICTTKKAQPSRSTASCFPRDCDVCIVVSIQFNRIVFTILRITYLNSSQCGRSGGRQGVTRGLTANGVGVNSHAIVVRIGVVIVHGHSGVGSYVQFDSSVSVLIEREGHDFWALLYRDSSVSRDQVCGVGAAFQGVVALLGAEVAVGSRNGDVGSRVQVYR